MKPKLYGIGKCGSRIVFDFSAFTYGHPTAFEVRVQPEAVGHVVSIYNRVQQGLLMLRDAVVKPAVTPLRIYTPYSSVAIESDMNGNEVTKLLVETVAKLSHVRPIENVCPLGDRTGGCGFGAISESLAKHWIDSRTYPEAMALDTAEDSIAFVASSLGGGTGSGSALVVARKLGKDYANRSGNRPCHVMMIGILPMTDLSYGNEAIPVFDFADSVNTGRALAAFLGSTLADPSRADPSLWLVANDLLRLRAPAGSRIETSTNDRSISVVNWHVASVACLLSNVGGAGDIHARGASLVRAESNFDPTEMNQHLSGRTFFTGYASKPYEPGDDRRFARTLCRRTLEPLDLSYSFSPQTAPVGAGIPFRSQYWKSDELDRWCGAAMTNSQPLTLPAELRTAGWVGVLYGQPVNAESGERLAAVLEAIGELFPAAHVQSYRFIHQYDKQDHLCLFVVDSFSAVAFAALCHYAVQAFGGGGEFAKNMEVAVASNDEQGLESLLSRLPEREEYTADPFGDEMARLDERDRLSRETLRIAFARLLRSYNRKLRPVIRPSIG